MHTSKEKIRRRLKRIAGQVAGLQRMVEEDRYCVDILTQVAAVRSALDAVGVALLTDHVRHCLLGNSEVRHKDARTKSTEQLAEEVRVALDRFLA